MSHEPPACPGCGLRGDYKFCPKCGTACHPPPATWHLVIGPDLPAAVDFLPGSPSPRGKLPGHHKYCGHCGLAMEPGAHFCGKCGSAFDGTL